MSVLDIRIPEWTIDAACRGMNPAIFYPHEGDRGTEAKKVCKRCEVRETCLTYALDYEAEHPGSRWGVYGGLTARQRRTMTANKRKP